MTAAANTTLPRRRFTVAEYYRMAESGILTEADRVELIEGEIVEMTPIGSTHAGTVNELTRLLVQQVDESAVVAVQNPVRLSDHSEPEPDLAVLRPRDDRYRSAHPGPSDVLLLVEVSEASLATDRDVKLPLYARHGIPVVWVVNLRDERLEVYTDPGEDGYRSRSDLVGDDVVTVDGIPHIEFTASDLF